MIIFLFFVFLFFLFISAAFIFLFYVFFPKFAGPEFIQNTLESKTDIFDLYAKEIKDTPETFLHYVNANSANAGLNSIEIANNFDTNWDSFYKTLENIIDDSSKNELKGERGS